MQLLSSGLTSREILKIEKGWSGVLLHLMQLLLLHLLLILVLSI